MGAYDHWCAQKPRLREKLRDSADASGITYTVRHAIAQVEQNVMAEQNDDLLRQQMGILFSCCKASVGLLEVPATATVWTAHRGKAITGGRTMFSWMAIALGAQMASWLYCYASGRVLAWVLQLCALAASTIALVVTHIKRSNGEGGVPTKSTVMPDEERLFREVDEQMRAFDRFSNDFAYLNEQSAARQVSPDSKAVALMSEMMEALYMCEDEARIAAADAADRMAMELGLKTIPYSEETRHFFTVLPSIRKTETMVPAIVAAKDCRLLKRGTAAVEIRKDRSVAHEVVERDPSGAGMPGGGVGNEVYRL